MSTATTPDFDDVATLLWRLGSMLSPSQLQGYLLGQLALGKTLDVAVWVKDAIHQIDGVEPPLEHEQDVLAAMLSPCIQLLRDSDLDIQLMLPPDEESLSQRAECLGYWCQGFLAGFAAAAKERDEQKPFSAVVSEAVSDIAAIAQVALSDDDEPEQAEQAFLQVVEHVRLAAMNIFLECVAPAAPAATEEAAPTATKSPSDLFNKKLH